MDAAALVAAPAAAMPSPSAVPAPAATPPPDDNLLDGRFRIDATEERSPLGEAFVAFDVRDGRPARLIHVATDVFSTPLVLERSQRELRQLEKTPAAGTGRVWGHGRLANGQLWIATAPLAGKSLEALAQEGGTLPLARACALLARIGDALLEAQKGGVIHRDVQPGNVRVLPDDSIEVVNFGLAVPFGDGVFGEPHYLSPEQAAGKPVDQRSNIYSLAAVLYRLVCGQPPFLGDVASLLGQHETADPVPPSRRRPELPAALDVLMVKAMAKSATRRHLTLRQFVKDVQELGATAGGHASAPAPSVPVKAPEPVVAAPLPEPATARTMMFGVELPKPLPAAVPQPEAPVAAVAAAAADPVALELAPTPAATIIAFAQPTEPVVPVLPPSNPTQGADAGAVADVPIAAAPASSSSESPAPPVAPGPSEPPAKARQVPASPPEQAAAPQPASPPEQFRETMWFAKGERDGSHVNGEQAVSALSDERPLQDRYRDDGSLSREDAARLSLRAGAHPPVRVPAHVPVRRLPGDRMDTKGIAAEMSRSNRRFGLVIAAVVLAIAAVGIVWAVR